MGNDLSQSGGEEQLPARRRTAGDSGHPRKRLPRGHSSSTSASATGPAPVAGQVRQVSALHHRAGNAAVAQQMRTRGGGGSVVGGGAGGVTYVASGTGKLGEVIAPGEEAYARRMLPDVAQRGASFTAAAAGLRLKSVEPDFTGLQRRIDWAAEKSTEHTEEADHWYTSYTWTKRHETTAKALKSHMERLETQRSVERQKFTEFNAWVPRANDMLISAGKLDAMQAMLGVGDPAAMVTAVRQQLEAAQTSAVRAQNRAAGGEPGGVQFNVPALDASVQSAEADVSNAAREMRVSWLGLEQNALAERAEEEQKKGEAAEKELKEIEEVKAFVRDVGKTVEISLSLMEGVSAVGEATTIGEVKKAGLKMAKDVGIPTSIEGISGAVVDFIYYDEIRKLKHTLTTIKAKCDAISGAAAAIEIRRKAEEFEVKVDAFALKSVQLQSRVAARQLAYLGLGEQLDVAARTDPDLRRSGTALAKGKERFAIVLLVTSQIRELLAMAEGARQGFDSPEDFRKWALTLDQERQTPDSFGELVTNYWGGLSKEERFSLGMVLGQVQGFHHNVAEMHKLLDPVDQAAAQLIKALSGGQGGQY